MQIEISYSRLKKRLPVRSQKIAPTTPLKFQQIFVKTKRNFLYELPSNRTPISHTLSPIGQLRFLGWYHLRNYAPYAYCFQYIYCKVAMEIFNNVCSVSMDKVF